MIDLQANMMCIAFVLSFLPFLITCILTGVGYNKFKDWLDIHVRFPVKVYWYPYLIALVFYIISLITKNNAKGLGNYILEQARNLDLNDMSKLTSYFFDFQPFMYVIWGCICGTYLLYRDVTRFNYNSEIIRNRKKKKEKLEDPSLVPLDYSKNIVIIGKNGSGKTVAISNFVQGHIESGQFCVIMDGKGDIGQFSLYDIVTRLCIKYNRKLYILNQSMPDETHSYNPFQGCNSTQIKDMLISMSDWSEEHYKALASEYFQALAQFMIDTKIPISFNSLIHYGMVENFASELEDRKELLTYGDYQYYYSVINRCGGPVQGSISRFSTLARGIGRKMFRDSNSFNLQNAYDEKAVVLVLLNNLEYSDFARGVGLLVINDVKNVLGKITKIKGKHEEFLCVYDELSVYFSEMMIDIVNKSRSLGGTNILSTQTIADMDIIDENARRIVINNMHGFYLLKQADDKSAEALAKAIGTKKASEITNKLDTFGKTGDGTSKIIDEFKVHPNDLKELPLGVGYWVDTMEKDYRPIRTKLPYVDVSKLEEYQFKENAGGSSVFPSDFEYKYKEKQSSTEKTVGAPASNKQLSYIERLASQNGFCLIHNKITVKKASEFIEFFKNMDSNSKPKDFEKYFTKSC